MVKCAVFVSVMVLSLGGAVQAYGAERRPGVNVALNRPYLYSTPPSYALCTDPGDTTQLTDGQSSGADWREKSTVGWSREKKPPYVVIDLGQVQPIDEVRIHSIGGGRANVFYPSIIAVLVSDDGATYHLAGGADNLDLEQNRVDSIAAPRSPHTFRIGELRTKGRYVLVLLEVDGDYVFVDELEVMRGAHDPETVAFPQSNAFPLTEVPSTLPLVRERAEARYALERWARAVETSPGNAASTLEALRRDLRDVAIHDADALEALQERIAQARGRWLGIVTGRRFLWERVNPMRQARPFDLPSRLDQSDADARRRIDVALWQGEYESAAVSLHHCGDTALSLRAVLTPLRAPGGDLLPAADTITLRRAVFVEARGEGRIGDALVKIPETGFRLEPGRSAQLWLTVHNPRLEPGTYHFAIDLTLSDRTAEATSFHEMIQGSLTVHPIRFPERPTLSTSTWAYIERCELTRDVPEQAIADLRAHYVNADVLFWSSCMPMPRVNADGHVEMRLNELRDALERYRGSDVHLFYWGLGRFRKNVPNLPEVGTPEWRRTMKDWLTKWVGYLKEQGVGYDRFLMYPFDEMLPDEFVTLARFVKEEADPNIRLFANSRGDRNGTELARIAPYIDVWSFRDVPYGAKLSLAEQRVRREAKSIWCYDCARPAKGKPPHGYYRLQMWRAFERGDTGCGFWTYTDPGEGQGDAWDDFSSLEGKYGVIYGPIGKPPRVELCGERIVPSRRWEAWREGVEDFEYLTKLRQALEVAEQRGRLGEAKKTRDILDRVVDDVLQNPGDVDRVYEARRVITEQLIHLSSANGSAVGE